MFIRTNEEREFLFVSVCKKDQNGKLKEWVRWTKGSDQPIFDLRYD
jgi:hypothetical protein